MGRSLQNIYKQHISKVLLNNVDSPKLQGTLVSRLLFSILSVYFSNHCSVGKWRETCSKKDISSSKFTWPVHQNCMEHWHMYNVRIPGPSKDIRIYWCSICSLVIIMESKVTRNEARKQGKKPGRKEARKKGNKKRGQGGRKQGRKQGSREAGKEAR